MENCKTVSIWFAIAICHFFSHAKCKNFCKPLILNANYNLKTYICTRYDTRTIESYEGPCGCPEEVSLTSLTDKIK